MDNYSKSKHNFETGGAVSLDVLFLMTHAAVESLNTQNNNNWGNACWEDLDIFSDSFLYVCSSCSSFDLVCFILYRCTLKSLFNGWQLAKMKKSILDMSLP